MLNGMCLSVDSFKFITRDTLKDWSIDKLEKFLDQAKKAYKDNEEIEKLFLEYLPQQFEFCEYVYLYHNEELLEEGGLDNELLALANDEMILELAGDFLDNIIIPIAEDFLKNK